MNSFSKYKIDAQEYLKIAKRRARLEGYDPDLLSLATKEQYPAKLVYDGVPFGRHPYGDFIIWSILEDRGDVRKGYANMKRDTYQTSHSRIKGKWKSDPKSPNTLSLKINW